MILNAGGRFDVVLGYAADDPCPHCPRTRAECRVMPCLTMDPVMRLESHLAESPPCCDRRGCKSPAVAAGVCCERVYARCVEHDGAAGVRRSMHSHGALTHPKVRR